MGGTGPNNVSFGAVAAAHARWVTWSATGNGTVPDNAAIASSDPQIYQNITATSLREMARVTSANHAAGGLELTGTNYKASALKNHGALAFAVRIRAESWNVYRNAGNGGIQVRILGPKFAANTAVLAKVRGTFTNTVKVLANTYSKATYDSSNKIGGYGVGNSFSSTTRVADGNSTNNYRDDAHKSYTLGVAQLIYGSTTIASWPSTEDIPGAGTGVYEEILLRVGQNDSTSHTNAISFNGKYIGAGLISMRWEGFGWKGRWVCFRFLTLQDGCALP